MNASEARSKTNSQGGQIASKKRLYVKYMASLKCKKNVKSVFNKKDLTPVISDNVIELYEDVTQAQMDDIKENIKKEGMEVVDETDSIIVDKAIALIKELIHESDQLPHISYEEIVNKDIILGNEHILRIFSEIQGISILQYIIYQKIEKVKELLLYSDLSIQDIASKLNYKNEYYLIAQLKKFTGLSPDYFREIKKKRELLTNGK